MAVRALPPTSAIGNPDLISRVMRGRGLSLIEQLVVLTILAVLTAGVLLVLPDTAARRSEREARRIAVLVGLACEQAAVSGRDVGIRVSTDALAFGRFEAGAFVPFAAGGNDPLRARPLPSGLHLRLWRDGIELPLADASAAQIACLAAGELTPFSLLLGDADGHAWRLRGHADRHVDVEPDDAP